jgi:hypothetical protein
MPVLLKFAEAGGGIRAAMTPIFTRLSLPSSRLEMVRGEARAQLRRWLKEISRVLKDERLLQEYFDAWTTMDGASYYRAFMKDHGMRVVTRQDRDAYAGLRHLWTCEAHNELITTYVDMKFDGRLKAAETRLDTLKKWMEGEPAG